MADLMDPIVEPTAGVEMGLIAAPTRLEGSNRSVGFWIAVSWLIFVAALALIAFVLPIADPTKAVAPPRQKPLTSWPEFLGTDALGRSVVSRLIYGGRVSLAVGVLAAAVGMILGGFVGVVAGYMRGKTDHVVGYLTDTILAFPPLVLLLALATFLEPSIPTVTISLGLITVPTFVRLARANTLKFATSEFVKVARLLGARHHQVIRREIIPNVVPTLIGYVVVLIPFLMVAEASLSFLGLGIRPPRPSWGVMVADGQSELRREPHLVLVPAAVLFLTVFAFNVVGERIRHHMRDTE